MPLLDMHSMPFICVSACTQYFCIQLMLFQKGVAGKSIGWRAFMQPKKGLGGIMYAMQGGMMDKFMSYTNRGLRGTAVHEYREAASAHNKHYDTGHKHEGHVHPGRFLLKAQPQQGKTGTTFPHTVLALLTVCN